MKKLAVKIVLLTLFGFFMNGCMISGGLIIHPEPIIIGSPPAKVVHTSKNVKKGNPNAHRLKIPRRHMPPQGMCRIWYTNRPPGHQPPPGSCRVLRRQVPYNAILVWG